MWNSDLSETSISWCCQGRNLFCSHANLERGQLTLVKYSKVCRQESGNESSRTTEDHIFRSYKLWTLCIRWKNVLVFRNQKHGWGSTNPCFLQCFKTVLVQATRRFCFGFLQSTLPRSWAALFPLLAGQCLLLTHEFGDSSFYSIARSLNKDLRKCTEETSK